MNRDRRRPLIVASHGLAGVALIGYGTLVSEILLTGFGAVLLAIGVVYLLLDLS